MPIMFGPEPGSDGDVYREIPRERKKEMKGKFITFEGLDGSGKQVTSYSGTVVFPHRTLLSTSVTICPITSTSVRSVTGTFHYH